MQKLLGSVIKLFIPPVLLFARLVGHVLLPGHGHFELLLELLVLLVLSPQLIGGHLNLRLQFHDLQSQLLELGERLHLTNARGHQLLLELLGVLAALGAVEEGGQQLFGRGINGVGSALAFAALILGQLSLPLAAQLLHALLKVLQRE